jgi:hypothetical protein
LRVPAAPSSRVCKRIIPSAIHIILATYAGISLIGWYCSSTDARKYAEFLSDKLELEVFVLLGCDIPRGFDHRSLVGTLVHGPSKTSKSARLEVITSPEEVSSLNSIHSGGYDIDNGRSVSSAEALIECLRSLADRAHSQVMNESVEPHFIAHLRYLTRALKHGIIPRLIEEDFKLCDTYCSIARFADTMAEVPDRSSRVP